jgi:hypothetical protein
MVDPEVLAEMLRARIDSHLEWLLVRESGRTFPLRRDEIDISSTAGKVMFGSFDDTGFRISRVVSACADEDPLVVELRFKRKRESITLIPRPSAREFSQTVERARLERANLIAEALITLFPDLRIIRVALNFDNARIAQIFVRDDKGRESAMISDVTGTMTHEAVMTSATVFAEKLRHRKKPISELWIAGDRKQSRNLQRLIALMNPNSAARFRIFAIKNDGDAPSLNELPTARLWREKATKLSFPTELRPSETAERIMNLAPDTTDVIFSKHGETIRHNGLPFARVRVLAGTEKAWFGIDRERRQLTDESWNELERLVADLEMYRAGDAANRRHELYRAAPEAWLESILRRNIRALDANLILSPIYNQFRTSMEKIDLLAIRRDGRLVIIELKISPDRETVFQAADYWRKIELQRRRGQLKRVRAFGDLEILDKPALVYVVAPALSFHRDFGLFAGMLSKEIELWRFELHENWRADIKVLVRRDHASLTNL